MFEGTRIQVDKLENGYGIKMPTFSNGGEPVERKYVFESFDALVGGLIAAFAPANHGVIIHRLIGVDMATTGSDRTLQRHLFRGRDAEIKKDPTPEEMRDELGELRRMLDRRKEKLEEVMTVNARLVKAEEAANNSMATARTNCNEWQDKAAKFEKFLIGNGIDVKTGKKKPAPRKR